MIFYERQRVKSAGGNGECMVCRGAEGPGAAARLDEARMAEKYRWKQPIGNDYFTKLVRAGTVNENARGLVHIPITILSIKYATKEIVIRRATRFRKSFLCQKLRKVCFSYRRSPHALLAIWLISQLKHVFKYVFYM